MLSDKYLDEIVAWNKKFNLTGLKGKEEIRRKLYNDSLNIMKAIDLSGDIKVIDVGCGAGLPGIPLKIEYPNINITLIDSTAKKIEFVNHAINILGLKNATAICTRAEDLARNMRERFDLAVSRAVAKLNVLCEYCLPLVKVGGLFIAQKGPDIDKELKMAMSAIDILGGNLKDRLKVDSGFLVVIEKVKPTPAKYPRHAGMPAKKPL